MLDPVFYHLYLQKPEQVKTFLAKNGLILKSEGFETGYGYRMLAEVM